MSDAITAIAQSLNADLERLRAASQNVANANTHGYRATRFLPAQQPDGTGNTVRDAAKLRERVILDAGSLQSTGRSLDMALSDGAFFSVMTPAGIQYTRAGSFELGPEGQLQTAEGFPVLAGNAPLELRDSSVTVTLDGEVIQQGEVVGVLDVAVPQPETIRATGNGLYSFMPVESVDGVTVHQGMLETSNVSVADEMIRIIEISRHVESTQRAIVTYDRMLDVGINQLGSKR